MAITSIHYKLIFDNDRGMTIATRRDLALHLAMLHFLSSSCDHSLFLFNHLMHIRRILSITQECALTIESGLSALHVHSGGHRHASLNSLLLHCLEVAVEVGSDVVLNQKALLHRHTRRIIQNNSSWIIQGLRLL